MKNKITAFTFIAFITAIFALSIFTKDVEFSAEEKRKLTQITIPTIETITDGTWFGSFENYSNDQFPLRSQMLYIDAWFRTFILNQKDIDGIFTENGYIFKSDYPTREDNVLRFAEKMNAVYEEYIKGKADNYYVSVIPDKTYYSSDNNLVTDALEISQKFYNNLTDAQYIDIFGALSLESYYKTDTHWSQDKLFDVMDVFASEMGFAKLDETQYNKLTLSNFYGVYSSQSALINQAEDLVYLESEYTLSATVDNLENPNFTEVYNLAEFNSEDGYNVFLDGATALTVITSPNATTDKELIIFRDSFGSSIAPLFLESYKTVTLVDLRYFSTEMLDEYIDFEGKDVLILYSSLILNSNIVFR
ncbi:MAG: DHHW family protein [Clostridia bacterium]